MADNERESDDDRTAEADDDGKINDPLTRSEVADEAPRVDWGKLSEE